MMRYQTLKVDIYDYSYQIVFLLYFIEIPTKAINVMIDMLINTKFVDIIDCNYFFNVLIPLRKHDPFSSIPLDVYINMLFEYVDSIAF